ncbi:MAG: undecaprenyl/decaprenyl-phosphate alpha-N-acetylglucosaminyl 1-phosphate transferase [Endomicrobia bacterium]|nr:undecaprenyl/decaprenyl-phosphate alpha-N-acetylglucosaminyl 1-phosphate transferase [Endomicrobiia bacterium]
MDYVSTLILSFFLSSILTPLCRVLAIKLSIFDYPVSDIKTHKIPVPYLGGIAIGISFYIIMFLVRITTHFPTGTLRSLRGIILGSIIIMLFGIIDDVKYKGIHFTTKFIGELIAAVILICYGMKINFITPEWLAIIITLLWIVGLTNAINLVDVMDGLSSGIAIITSLGLFLITKVGKEEIYISYAVLSLAGACLGFLPYNLSSKYKIFMGDTGALFLGFILAAVTLGGNYSINNSLGVLSPVVILLIPIYETCLISMLRINRGQSPFKGSKDHFALRLLSFGIPKYKILGITYLANLILVIKGLLIVLSKQVIIPVLVVGILIIFLIIITKFLVKIEI